MLSSESFKQLNKTFAIPKSEATDSSVHSSTFALGLPNRSLVADTKRKPSVNERSLQSKLDSIKTIEFSIYREVFTETLAQMTNYRDVLEEVKQGYDSRICSLEDTNSSNAAQIQQLQEALDNEMRDKGVFQRRLKQLAQENYQLNW
jgi:hypothetical protein